MMENQTPQETKSASQHDDETGALLDELKEANRLLLSLDTLETKLSQQSESTCLLVLRIYGRIIRRDDCEKWVNDQLETLEIKCQKKTGLILRISKLMVGSNDDRGRRANDWANVIAKAALKFDLKKAPTKQVVSKWLQESGGITNLKRAIKSDETSSEDKQTKQEKFNQRVKDTKTVFKIRMKVHGSKSGDLVTLYGVTRPDGIEVTLASKATAPNDAASIEYLGDRTKSSWDDIFEVVSPERFSNFQPEEDPAQEAADSAQAVQ